MQTVNWINIGIYYLIAINVLTWILYAVDKIKAVTYSWRIPEKVLLLSAFVGGSLGAFLAMLQFRHKLRHKRFALGVPFCLLLHIALIIILWLKYM